MFLANCRLNLMVRLISLPMLLCMKTVFVMKYLINSNGCNFRMYDVFFWYSAVVAGQWLPSLRHITDICLQLVSLLFRIPRICCSSAVVSFVREGERDYSWEAMFPSPPGKGLERARPTPKKIIWPQNGAFKLDLTEETRTWLQEEEAVASASSCLILATPMRPRKASCCKANDLRFKARNFGLKAKVT